MKKTFSLLFAAAALVIPCALTSCGGGSDDGGVGGAIRGEASNVVKFLSYSEIHISRAGTDSMILYLKDYTGTKAVNGVIRFGSSEAYTGKLIVDSYHLSDKGALESMDCTFSIESERIVDDTGWAVFWGLGTGYDKITPKENINIHMEITARPQGNLWEGNASGSGTFNANIAGTSTVKEDIPGQFGPAYMQIIR